MSNLLKKITPGRLLTLFIFINLAVGLLIVADYGISMDERREQMRAEMALLAYTNDPAVNYDSIGLAQVYGTGQSVLFQLADDLLSPRLHSGPRVVAHYGYFVTFQVAIVALYFLAKRFFNPWLAFSVALLFGLQPLYFGHAFINPKDIPLMAVFLGTVVLGLHMADRVLESPAEPAGKNAATLLKQDWQSFKARRPWWLLALDLMLVGLLIFTPQVKLWLASAVLWAYQAPAASLPGRLFALVASQKDTLPSSYYVDKLQALYEHYILWIVLALLLIQLALVVIPQTSKALLSLRLFSDKPCSTLVHQLRNPALLIAAVVWGLCLATRMIGLAAGGMVGLYLLLRGRKRAVIPLLVYTLVALAVLYLAWPYLWFTGLGGLSRSLLLLEDFPVKLAILFRGRSYTGIKLPLGYLPTLLSIQFTLPLVALALAGMGVATYRWQKKQTQRTQLLILSAWLLLPIAFVMLSGTNLYHNFRQLLFITPPLFIFAGFSLQALFQYLRRTWLKVILVGLALLPGLISIISLHPYQYVYYNQLVGGVDGAFRQYDLDYWMISIKETTEVANRVMPPNSKLNGWYAGSRSIEHYLRDDIELVSHREFSGPRAPGFDYVMLPSWDNFDLGHYDYGKDVYQVKVGEAVLMVLRKVK